MISTTYADGTIIMKRAPSVWQEARSHPKKRRPRYRRLKSGNASPASATYCHTMYKLRVEKFCNDPFDSQDKQDKQDEQDEESPLEPFDMELPLIKRRRAMVNYCDIVKAHQAYKLHNTPKATRKQWE